MMRKKKLWLIQGWLWKADEHRSKATARRVVLVAENYQEAHDNSEAVLIHNWSAVPHEVEVESIVPIAGSALSLDSRTAEVYVP